MSVVGMTKGIKLSPLRCLLYEFPKLSTLKLHTILYYTIEKRQSHTIGNSVLCPAILQILNPHIHPNPDFHFPRNSHSSSHLASCCYTQLSPGHFSPKYYQPTMSDTALG